MLLRRLLRHWKTQNWLGVLLDLLVVIAGILIGLRIDAWRDQVQDREDEQQYLERLLDDAEANTRGIEDVLERMDYLREEGRQALERLLSGEVLSPDDQARTVRALVVAGELPNPAVARGTYDELIATGRMPIIEDQELRTLLQQEMAAHLKAAARAQAHRQALIQAEPFSDRHAILAGEATSAGVKLEKRYDLVSLRQDSEALVAFFNQIEASEQFSAERQAELGKATEVRDRLRCLLKKSTCLQRRSPLSRMQVEN